MQQIMQSCSWSCSNKYSLGPAATSAVSVLNLVLQQKVQSWSWFYSRNCSFGLVFILGLLLDQDQDHYQDQRLRLASANLYLGFAAESEVLVLVLLGDPVKDLKIFFSKTTHLSIHLIFAFRLETHIFVGSSQKLMLFNLLLNSVGHFLIFFLPNMYRVSHLFYCRCSLQKFLFSFFKVFLSNRISGTQKPSIHCPVQTSTFFSRLRDFKNKAIAKPNFFV